MKRIWLVIKTTFNTIKISWNLTKEYHKTLDKIVESLKKRKEWET